LRIPPKTEKKWKEERKDISEGGEIWEKVEREETVGKRLKLV
jgi:hypothetical protein